MDLPSSSQHWDAESPEAWAGLHPWSSAMPALIKFSSVLDSLLRDELHSAAAITDDYQKQILLTTILRLMWDMLELEFSPGSRALVGSEGLDARRRVLHASIPTLAPPLSLTTRTIRDTSFQATVQHSCLARFVSIIDADDLINYTHLTWRGGPTLGPAQKALLGWAAKNPKKVRSVARASGYVWGAIR